MSAHNAVTEALAALRAGRPVVVVDDETRENEGDLVLAAEFATPELLSFVVRHTSGFVCVALSEERCDALGLPLMVAEQDNDEAQRTAFTVTVDARVGVSTGISAADRALTARVLADPAARRTDLVRPGHLVPLRARAGGVLERPGHTEAAVDLCRLAGLRPAGLLCELVNDDGTMSRRPDLVRFAARHALPLLTIRQLAAHRQADTGPAVTPLGSARLPTDVGEFPLRLFRSAGDGAEHLAIVRGDPATAPEPLVRLHSECLTGDTLGSLRCDCGAQLRQAMAHVAAAGHGVVVYLRGHEGRGIGLAAKLAAYGLQDDGHDTVTANLALGFPADLRDFTPAAHILRAVGVRRCRLLTNNPRKSEALTAAGVEVTRRVPMPPTLTPDNVRYLRAKRELLGHLIDGLDEPAEPTMCGISS